MHARGYDDHCQPVWRVVPNAYLHDISESPTQVFLKMYVSQVQIAQRSCLSMHP